jgi:hypothetical protein
MRDALRRRAEAFGVFRLAAHADGEQRPAMERLRERDDFDFLRTGVVDSVTAREFQRGFVRFCAGIREERAIGESQVREASCKPQHRLVRVAITDMPELLALIVEHFQQFGVCVAQRRHRNTTGEIDVVTTFRIPYAGTESAIRHEIRRGEKRHHHFVERTARYIEIRHEPLLCLFGYSSLCSSSHIVIRW